MDSQIEEIKIKLNIVDVIGSYLKLTKTGVNFRGVCPFHSEKTPSFFVNPGRQMWHCFGCGAGSSMFDFVMKIEGVEFGDALRILANKAGVQLKRENIQLRTERQRLYEICELATKFFEKQLEASAVGREVESYLLKRGIIKESVKKWRIGYSPDTWNGLSDFLVGKGYAREEVVKAGLAIEKESKKDSYDRFRGRIIFPVFDLNSNPVGFGGRVFKVANEKETAKYINTPQTLLYDKSGVIYGLNNAKLAIRKQNQCVVTEGYTDVIMCHQAGFENTIAASGTALTNQHLTILKRYSENLILAFDMDIAGDSATKRGINLAQEQGFNIKVIETYLKDSDPADIILKDPASWQKYIGDARSIMDYYFDSAFSSFDKENPQGKKDIAKILLPVIKRLANKIEQSYWIQKLSEKLGIKEEAIQEELSKVKIDPPPPVPPNGQDGVGARKSFGTADGQAPEKRKVLIEDKIISLILKDPININLISEERYALFSEKVRNFLELIKKIVQDPPPNEFGVGANKNVSYEEQVEKNFKDMVSGMIQDESSIDAEFKNFLAALTLRAETDYQEDGQEEFMLCLSELERIESKNKQNQMVKEIEKETDEQKQKDLMQKFDKEAKKFHSIN